MYEIIRCYYKDKPVEVIKTGLTLVEARKHCNDPSTRKEGEWFDAYRKE